MQEKFIYFIWENKLFFTKNLQTTAGESLQILDTGIRNLNAGPDFFNAKIKINNTIWAGNVEMHKRASDWEKHGHSADKAYENVILHVVEQADKRTFRRNGTEIATLKLTWPEQYNDNYKKLLNSKLWIACQKQFYRIDPLFLRLAYHRLMIERLENKITEISCLLEDNGNDWNETFYQILARMFGFKINSIPFELLAKSLPLKILLKHKNNLFQLESLLFGVSGMLTGNITGEDYYMELKKEFNFLQNKYKLKTVEPHIWKFMRTRPVNFPTIRIAQLAGLILRSQGLFSKLMTIKNIEEMKNLLRVKTSEYWYSHYLFNSPASKKAIKEIGDASIKIIIINVIIPFLFVYGEKQCQPHLKDRALDFLEKLPAENNSIIKKWKELGVNPLSAFETQSLLQLKTMYCERKKCLNCPVGNQLIRFA